jgi:CheY-like chemotaxis protein
MPTVVLLDLQLPITSGFEVLAAAREDPTLAQRYAFVVLTAYPEWLPVLAALDTTLTKTGTSAQKEGDPVPLSVLVKPTRLRQLIRAIEGAAEHPTACPGGAGNHAEAREIRRPGRVRRDDDSADAPATGAPYQPY